MLGKKRASPRMTIPTQLVLHALLAEPTQEMYGLQICAEARRNALALAVTSPGPGSVGSLKAAGSPGASVPAGDWWPSVSQGRALMAALHLAMQPGSQRPCHSIAAVAGAALPR